MCGRFTLRTAASAIAEQFALLDTPDFGARYNIAPSQPVPVIRLRTESPRGDGDAAADNAKRFESGSRRRSSVPLASHPRELIWLRWGLIPSWAKDPAIGNRMINARAETAAEKPAFRAAMRHRRCLIVADGFYEWRRTGPSKQPYLVHLRGGRPFAFAGLWEAWEGPDHSMLETCTILTTAANDLLRPIHDRMPAILEPCDYIPWLNPAIEDPHQLSLLLRPYGGETMEAIAVGDFVNNPSHDSPQCVEPTLQKDNVTLPGF